MSVNSSSSHNTSLPFAPLSFYNSMSYLIYNCMRSTSGTFSITAFTITSILLILPICILVFYLCHQRWQQRGSSTTMSHSDLLTYHVVLIELLNIFGSILCCCGVHTSLPEMVLVGIFPLCINITGQMFFHILTCVERYLAVVHPITYRGMRKANVIRGRNITIGCVWLVSFASAATMCLADTMSTIIFIFCTLGVAFIVISFFSLSVLCALIRPGPADGVGGRQQIDQSKLRAFYTITAILGTLLLRFVGKILTIAVHFSQQLVEAERCGLWLSVLWFCLPSSLVLPLLFLYRTGKLLCCKKNTQSGQESD